MSRIGIRRSRDARQRPGADRRRLCQGEGGGAPEVYWMMQDSNATARKLHDRIADRTPFLVYQENIQGPV